MLNQPVEVSPPHASIFASSLTWQLPSQQLQNLTHFFWRGLIVTAKVWNQNTRKYLKLRVMLKYHTQKDTPSPHEPPSHMLVSVPHHEPYSSTQLLSSLGGICHCCHCCHYCHCCHCCHYCHCYGHGSHGNRGSYLNYKYLELSLEPSDPPSLELSPSHLLHVFLQCSQTALPSLHVWVSQYCLYVGQL